MVIAKYGHLYVRSSPPSSSPDYEEEYAQYGRSLEEDVAVSPSTAAEFMYHRDVRTTPSLGAYLGSGEGEGEGRRVPQISPLATSVAAVTLESRSEGAATPNGRKVVGESRLSGFVFHSKKFLVML